MTSANDVLMGAGVQSVKLTEGVTVTGRIVGISEPYQEREYERDNPGGGKPKVFPSGDPIMTFTVDLDTGVTDPNVEGDDGVRRIYMDGSRIKKVIREAVRAASARGLTVGGTLQVTCTHYDTPGDVRSGKNYAALYVPGVAANNVLMQPQAVPAAPVAVAPVVQPAPVLQAVAAPQPAVSLPVYAPAAVPPPQPTPVVAPAPVTVPQPTPEQVAAVRAAGMDPAAVWPGFTG